MGEEKNASPKTGVNSATEDTHINKKKDFTTKQQTSSKASTIESINLTDVQQVSVKENAISSNGTTGEEQINETSSSNFQKSENSLNSLRTNNSDNKAEVIKVTIKEYITEATKEQNVQANTEEVAETQFIQDDREVEQVAQTLEEEQINLEIKDEKKFCLRIVPLEKLLAKPDTNEVKRPVRVLRERNAKNISIIELSSTDEDEDDEDCYILTNNNKKDNSGADKSEKTTTNNSKESFSRKAVSGKRKNQLVSSEESEENTTLSGKHNIKSSVNKKANESEDEEVIIITETIGKGQEQNDSDIREEITLKQKQNKCQRKESTASESSQTVNTKQHSRRDKKSESRADIPTKQSRGRRRGSVNSTVSSISRSSELNVVASKRKGNATEASHRLVYSDYRKSVAIDSNEQSSKPLTGNTCGAFIIKRCLVRVKRISLDKWSTITEKNSKKSKTQAQRKMDFYDTASTSNSKRKRNLSDSDSDYAVAANEEVATVETDSDDVGAAGSSSDSEVMPQRKKRGIPEKNRNRGSSSASDDDNDDGSSDYEPKSATGKNSAKKRRRIKRNSSDDSDNGDDDDKNKHKRKHIRKIIRAKDLDVTTKEAHKEEEDRRKRIEERQKIYNQIFEKPDNVEIKELVLDFDDETKTALLEVDKQLLKKLKPHQVAGVKFMWDACFETLKDAEDKPGSGCILAHCMGLGKTLQIVTLSHTLLSNSRRTHVERVLIISPLSTLNNWAREFKHWMSFARKRDIEIYDISRYKDKPTRIFKLYEWFQEGGVCILGYDMYRILANDKAKGLRKKQREQLQESLVDPGPDMVVCDEGHLLKNEKTSISKAVTKMRTKRRIVLTGTPLQNNLKEYYCMIQFIKPNLLGTYKEYMNRFVNPISNGQYTDSTERDIRLMKHRSHILHKMLEGCIQRRDYSVLAPYLPPKHEYVVYTTLSELQQELYEYYMTTQRDISTTDIGGKGARLFQDFQDLRRIWTHPMNLRVNSDNVIAKRLLKEDDEGSDLDGFICDETESDGCSSSSDSDAASFKSDASGAGGSSAAVAGKGKRRKTRNTNGVGGDDSDDQLSIPGSTAHQKDDPSEWWKRFVDDKELNNVNHSPKLLILMRLLQQCEAIGDKLLVFSQSLQSLDVIEHFLMLVDSNTNGYEFEGDIGNCKGFWKPGEDYFRLDGSCSVEQRESMCKKFNDTSNLRARLFLISTRAGGLGINLVAANRVVIFDVSWNPSHDTQSIFRVYRFGQTKPCYIYRLIAMGTMEQKVYERQVAKQATAKRVIDEQQISRHYNQTDLMELYTYELKPNMEREVPILPKDRLFAELLSEHERLIFKYHEHDSLLEQEENESLSDSERKAAWAEYEAEKTRTVQSSQYISYDRTAFGAGFGGQMAAQFGNAAGTVTSNKIFGFRSDILLQLLNMKIAKDYPEMSQNQVIQLVPTYLQSLYTQMNNGDPTLYKDLLNLHSTIVHPSGMYMNPLLYANQNPSAAGYFQSGSGGAAPSGAAPADNGAAKQGSSAGFETDKVYEID